MNIKSVFFLESIFIKMEFNRCKEFISVNYYLKYLLFIFDLRLDCNTIKSLPFVGISLNIKVKS